MLSTPVRNPRRGPSIRASPQQRSHLVAIAKEGNEEFRRTVLKDKTQRSIAPAFKKILAQFAYPETAMRARLPESLGKITEGQQAFCFLAFR